MADRGNSHDQMSLFHVDTFTVSRASSLDDLRWVISTCREEGWTTRGKDPECYFSADMSSNFFIGELEGKKISCIAVHEFGDRYCRIGNFIVVPQYRGKGYGLRTWKHAMGAVGGEQRNIVLDSVVDMVDKYETRNGFRKDFVIVKHDMFAYSVAEALSATTSPVGIKILPGSGVDINKLAEYDRSIYGVNRMLLLSSWISLEDSISFVAVDEQSTLVGFIILVKDYKGCYCAFPYASDTLVTAQVLLKKSLDCVSPIDPQLKLATYIPEDNQVGIKMVEEQFGAVPKTKCVRMCTEGSLNMPLSSIYGISTLE